MDRHALSRVIQGLAAGIGFLGAGTILKLSEEREVRGLTTAAGVWLTAAVGAAVGLGMLWPAALGAALAWVVLGTLHALERKAGERGDGHHV
jgi:putative Mg2+ transporter-C (MgtC) family protein